MAQEYNAGAIHVYIAVTSTYYSVGNGTISYATPAYLGTGERAPRVSRRRAFTPVHNDLAGAEPFDYCFSGTNMLVTVRMTRWDENVLRIIEHAANPALGLVPTGAVAGTEFLGDIGRLMVTEATAIQLWLRFAYGAQGVLPKPAFAGNAASGPMRNGWHFYAAFMEQDDHDGGTDPNVKSITFRCARVYDPFTGSFGIYDDDMSGILGVVPN